MSPAARLAWLLPLLALAGCEGCELVTGPEFQIRRALHAEAARLGESTGLEVRFVTSGVEVDGGRARVYARGEADGTYRGLVTHALTTEVVSLRRGPDGWAVEGFPLGRLAGVVDALEARHRAFAEGDAEAYLAVVDPGYRDGGTDYAALAKRVRRLLAGEESEQQLFERVIRIDRHRATVTESYRLTAHSGEREITRDGRARYTLVEDDGRWRFTSGLM